jgi:hypothetical protein
VRRVLLIALAIAFIPVLYSYVTTMMQPSNVSFGVRTVEWIRDHGGAGIVSRVESVWYSFNAPSPGGPTLKQLPSVGIAAAVPPVVHRHHVKPPYRPRRITPVIYPALPGEGVWHRAGPAVHGGPPLLLTTFRSEAAYPRIVAGVAWFDAKRTRLVLYPGRVEPPVGPHGPMEIPPALRRSVVAAFNSGFKLQDMVGGVYTLHHLYRPLVKGIGTIVSYANGRIDIRNWEGGPTPPPGVTLVRQNLPLIVDHGRLNPNLSDGPQWGETLYNAVRVWRTGLGVDRRGNLIYAAANDQTVGTLAKILQRAGAVRAIELDINPYWVSFLSYGRWGAHDPAKLLPDIQRPIDRYLSPDDRDFFAVYRR